MLRCERVGMVVVYVFLCMAALGLPCSGLKFVQLQSLASRQFVTVYWPDGSVRVDSVPYTHASTFELHVLESGQWQLRAMKNNFYLSAEGGGGSSCSVNRSEASGWETFNVTYVTNDLVQLQTFSGNYLGIDGSGTSSLIATATQAGNTETFQLHDIPQHRAVNLGSWFVPEKWMFDEASALWADTDATDLYTLCLSLGQEEATQRMKAHWESWFTRDDFSVMASNGVNHVRIPIGYWDIIETYPYIYGAASYIDAAIEWAHEMNISVLLDLHGAPGSQNGQDHSGKAGAIEWPQEENVAETVAVLGLIAERWASHPAVWGIEMLNEPAGDISHDLLTSFYRDGYDAIRAYDDAVHVVMCSLYGPHDWTANVLPEPQYRNAVLDLHLYTVWSGFTTPQQYYDAAVQWGYDIRYLTPYYPIIVGEMSLATALTDYTPEMRQEFADNEMTSFRDNAFAYIFWSDKLQYHSEDWSFVDGFSYIKDYFLSV